MALHAEARLLAVAVAVAVAGAGPAPEPPDGGWPNHPVRAAAQLASDRLDPRALRLCRLTALDSWPSVSAAIAAAAAGADETTAARSLQEAVDVGLLDALPDRRYRFRPEIRRHLAESATAEYGLRACADAVDRVLGLAQARSPGVPDCPAGKLADRAAGGVSGDFR
ncbi:hypothetical protein ACF1E9_15055 [Streptomyces roseolus]|uniref:hypothetical protein n=1 Tax=Streptomyces roseolus TaxID=67358 RepID=UPI003703343F